MIKTVEKQVYYKLEGFQPPLVCGELERKKDLGEKEQDTTLSSCNILPGPIL